MQTPQPGHIYSSHYNQCDPIFQNYQNKRLQRLREQRQRMENMKEVVGQYSTIIGELQYRNRELVSENQQLRRMLNVNGNLSGGLNQYSNNILKRKQADIQIIQLQRAYDQLCREYDRERNMRENCQLLIQNLREQLHNACQATRNLSTNSLMNNYSLYSGQGTEVQANYHALIGLYEQLKKQVYVLNKENISLKTCYQKDEFWKQNKREFAENDQNSSLNKYNSKPGLIRTASKTTIKAPSSSQSQSKQNNPQTLTATASLSSNTPINSSKSKRDYQLQLKKQADLIQKFKKTQRQQLELIEILKNQKSRICSHHALMMTSKKLLLAKGQDGIVSFKNQGKQGNM